MKKLLLFPIVFIFFLSCSNNKKQATDKKETKIALRTDTLNIVKLSDTLIIYESTCRGCAYEESTSFEIKDSLGIVKLYSIVTTDNSPADMNGGSISKNLLLLPLKTGITTIKLYKFWGNETTAEDSARFTPFTIDVRN